jgi:hypothetical protein
VTRLDGERGMERFECLKAGHLIGACHSFASLFPSFYQTLPSCVTSARLY